MKNTLRVLAVALALVVIGSAQDTNEISPDFSRAANLALVAIKNSDNTDTEGPDNIVREAINSVDAAAFNEEENAVAKRIKIMAYFRPITFALHMLTLTNVYTEAEGSQSARREGRKKKKQECEVTKARDVAHGSPGLTPAGKSEIDKVTAELNKIDSCIAATCIAESFRPRAKRVQLGAPYPRVRH